jgi:hypothetical protein
MIISICDNDKHIQIILLVAGITCWCPTPFFRPLVATLLWWSGLIYTHMLKKTMDFCLVRCHLLFFVGKRRRQLASHGWSGVAWTSGPTASFVDGSTQWASLRAVGEAHPPIQGLTSPMVQLGGVSGVAVFSSILDLYGRHPLALSGFYLVASLIQ